MKEVLMSQTLHGSQKHLFVSVCVFMRAVLMSSVGGEVVVMSCGDGGCGGGGGGVIWLMLGLLVRLSGVRNECTLYSVLFSPCLHHRGLAALPLCCAPGAQAAASEEQVQRRWRPRPWPDGPVRCRAQRPQDQVRWPTVSRHASKISASFNQKSNLWVTPPLIFIIVTSLKIYITLLSFFSCTGVHKIMKYHPPRYGKYHT